MVLQNAEEAAEIKKRRTFRKFSYRGIDLDKYVSARIFIERYKRDAAQSNGWTGDENETIDGGRSC